MASTPVSPNRQFDKKEPAMTKAFVDVSVIIPIYNSEPFLSACLESICGQTLRSIEIICVNDGSTDHSQVVIDQFAQKDPRIHSLLKENGGQSSARNYGMKIAVGRYIYFMDSDDVLERNALEVLVRRSDAENLDILFFRWNSFSDDASVQIQHENEIIKSFEDFHFDHVVSGQDMFCEMIEHSAYNTSVCIQLTRHDYILVHHLSFCEGIVQEDELYTPLCLLQADRTAILPDCFFKRRVRPDSTMTKKWGLRNVMGYFTAFIGVAQFFLSLNPTGRLEAACKKHLFSLYRMSAMIWSNLSPEERAVPPFPKNSLLSLFFDLIISGKEGMVTKELLFAQENYQSVINSASFKIGRVITAIPRNLRRNK